MTARWRIEPLADHDRSTFSSGVEPLDRYLRQQAGQDAKRHVATTWLLVDPDGVISGYYTLSASSVSLDALPPDQVKRLKLPRYPQVPVTLLGRLAVNADHQGKGFGRILLVDALARSFRATARVASLAVSVDAKDDDAARYYVRFGFLPFPDLAQRLFLPMTVIARLIADSP